MGHGFEIGNTCLDFGHLRFGEGSEVAVDLLAFRKGGNGSHRIVVVQHDDVQEVHFGGVTPSQEEGAVQGRPGAVRKVGGDQDLANSHAFLLGLRVGGDARHRDGLPGPAGICHDPHPVWQSGPDLASPGQVDPGYPGGVAKKEMRHDFAICLTPRFRTGWR